MSLKSKKSNQRGKNQMSGRQAWQVLRRLLKYVGANRWLVALLVVLVVIDSLLQVGRTYLSKPIIDEAIMPFIGQQSPALEALTWFIGLLVAVSLARVMTNAAYQLLELRISARVGRKLRQDVFAALQRQPVSRLESGRKGDQMSLFTNDIDAAESLLSQTLSSFVSSIVMMIGMYVMMLSLSWQLTLVMTASLAVTFRLTGAIAKRGQKFFRQRQTDVAKLNGLAEELIAGQSVVAAYNHQATTGQQFNKLNQKLFASSRQALLWGSVIFPVAHSFGYINYALMAAIGAVMTINGWLALGSLVAFLQASRSFSDPVLSLAQLSANVMQALAGAERLFKVLDAPAEVDDGQERIKFNPQARRYDWHFKSGEVKPLIGEVKFDKVWFTYDEKSAPILKNVSFTVKPGEKIALVGATGAGKTTITNLLTRFYEVERGKITIDGVNIKEIRKSDLSKILAIVLQETHLFTATIEENIRYGRLDATDQEVAAAAKRVNADSFIQSLNDNYQTKITDDGESLSQGQRQLLSIARAAVANPQILLLDEATSSIDTRTEKLIQTGMFELMKGRTTFIIAHRLNTILGADQILVLEAGKVVEAGTHAELLAQHGRYYDLYTGKVELD